MADNKVKQQYEVMPYPPRLPDNERKLLFVTCGDFLSEINHYCFNGKMQFDNNFRVLVAGGGTGDNAIYLAEQLRDTSAEIFYMDLSQASCDIAKARAQVRNLNNINWFVDSIDNIGNLNIGKFDYIACTGVLHHLDNPESGLKILNTALKPHGAMYIMLYGTYGRRAIYPLQNLLRSIIPQDIGYHEKVSLARKILKILPESNYFNRDIEVWEREVKLDEALYDLLLHSTDRSYSVSDVYHFARSADLNVVKFLGEDRWNYCYENLVNDKGLRKTIKLLDSKKQTILTDKLYARHIKHDFYLSSNVNSVATINDEELAIFMTNNMYQKNMELYREIQPTKNTEIDYEYNNKTHKITLNGNKINKLIFKYMDGKTPIKDILEIVSKETKSDKAKVKCEIKNVFYQFHDLRWAFLQSPR